VDRSTDESSPGRARPSGGSSHARPPGIALTIKQASQACHVGAIPLERLAGQRAFPNAYMDADDAAWRIPVADLEAASGRPRRHLVTDIGTGIIYAVVFLALYQLDTLADESPWSLDPWVEHHFAWWRKLSEPLVQGQGRR